MAFHVERPGLDQPHIMYMPDLRRTWSFANLCVFVLMHRCGF